MARVFRQRWSRTLPDGRKEKGQSAKWYVEYVDWEGIRRRVPGHADKGATAQLAARLERDAARRREGVTDAFTESGKRPLTDHLAEWHAALVDRGNSDKHSDLLKTRVTAVLSGCDRWSDVSLSRVQAALAALKRKDKLGAQTLAHYASAAKGFCKWAVEDGRATINPLAGLRPRSGREEPRHARRPLSVEELDLLIQVAREGEPWRGIDGVDRAVVYQVAAGTGLRVAEIRALRVDSFKLSAIPARVMAKAGSTKNGKPAVLPIRDSLAVVLRDYFASKLPDAAAFRIPPSYDTADMIHHDLDAARVRWIAGAKSEADRREREEGDFLKYQNREGRFADFHSLRHFYVSSLAASGVHPKVLQTLARHSTAVLSLNVYSHVGLSELADGLDGLPDVGGVIQPAETKAESQRASAAG